MLKFMILSSLTVFFIFQNVECVSYNFGSCPKIKSFQNFNITKFLGSWYIVQADDLSTSCATMTFKATKSSSKFDVEQSGNFKTLPIIKHFVTRTGKMKIIDKENPAGLKIQWHWGFPSQYMVVFDTDHSNYAGVFLCSVMGITSETRTFTLSRTPTLNSSFKEKVKESLKLNDFSTSGLNEVEHEDCPTKDTEDTFKLEINLDTLSPKSIGKKIDKEIKKNFEKEECITESSLEQSTDRK